MLQDSKKTAHNHVLLRIIEYFIESAVTDSENIQAGAFCLFVSNISWCSLEASIRDDL